MATYTGKGSGTTGGPSYTLELNVWESFLSGSNDNYSTVNWSLILISSNYSFADWTIPTYVNVDGQVYNASPKLSIGKNSRLQISSGSKKITHNSNGSKSISCSANINNKGASYLPGYASCSGTFKLSDIPRYSVISSADNFNDEGNPTIRFTNPSNGAFALRAKIEARGNTQLITRDLAKTATSCTFDLTEIERNTLRSLTPNSNSLNVRFTICCVNGNTELSTSYLDRTMTVVSANPVFSRFSYLDANAETVAITGNPQYIVKDKSNLRVKIPADDKMTTLKYATPKNYVLNFESKNVTQDYSEDELDIDLGTINTAGIQRLNVRAYDSRNNSTLASTDITVFDYDKPVINATVTRLNNFEAQTTLTVAGTYSLLTIDGDNKNSLTSLQYRYKEADGEWADWENLEFTVTEDKYVCADIVLNCDNTKAFEFEVQVNDVLDSNNVSLTLDVGQAIFFVSSNKKECYINNKRILVEGTVLYDDDIGEFNLIPLVDSSKKYEYIDIFYYRTAINVYSFVRVYNPYGKIVDLTTHFLTGDSLVLQLNLKTVTINEMEIVSNHDFFVNFNNSDTLDFGGEQDGIRIHRVVGYNKQEVD